MKNGKLYEDFMVAGGGSRDSTDEGTKAVEEIVGGGRIKHRCEFSRLTEYRKPNLTSLQTQTGDY